MSYEDTIDKEKSTFDKKGNIIKAVIKDGVTFLGDGVFHSCSSLTSATIPNSVTGIRWDVLEYCTNLKSMNIPDSIKYIGSDVFRGCYSLKDYKNRYFKITNSDMSCLRRHYTMNKWYYIKGEPKICERGFHACTRPTDCFNYYCGDINDLRFFEVELGDKIIEHFYDSKVCSNKIKFIKEYSFKEFVELANNS